MRSRTLALAVIVLAAPAVLRAQQASPSPAPAGHEHHHPAASTAPKADMMARCQEMMAGRQKMMDEMRAADTRLDSLVTRMNSAKGDDERLDALTAVLNELVAQHRKMHEHMASMPQMMGHAMQHMAGGAMDCPMMKETPAKP